MTEKVDSSDYLDMVLTTGKLVRLRFRDDICEMPSASDIADHIPSEPTSECKQIYNQYADSDGNLIVITDE